MSVQITYTIGIKRKLLPGFKEYTVHNHVREGEWLVLTLTDGSIVTIPEIGKKSIKVYADHGVEKARVDKIRHEVAGQLQLDQIHVEQQYIEARQPGVKAVK